MRAGCGAEQWLHLAAGSAAASHDLGVRSPEFPPLSRLTVLRSSSTSLRFTKARYCTSRPSDGRGGLPQTRCGAGGVPNDYQG